MEARVKEYARLLVEVGLNVQKGQTVLLRAPVESAAFARLCAEAAYDVGCREVVMDYTDDVLSRMKCLRADDVIFDICPAWLADKMISYGKQGAGMLAILGDDPEAMKGVDSDRLRRSALASGKAMEEFMHMQMSNEIPWCAGAVPTPAWAKLVFPDKPIEEATQALWNAILAAVHVTGDGTAVARWQEHKEKTKERCEKLNGYQFTSLHYQNALGTDLKVALPKHHMWIGCAEKCKAGFEFVANMPTEEIFTAPMRTGVEGKVVASMPFSINGNVIHHFSFELKEGKIVHIEAENEEALSILQNAISVDEGAAFLGEAALVPFSSPIAKMGILFYNTLFDENAACHFAFGKAYPCLDGADKMSQEELVQHGLNDSFTHQDFMVGTRDLSIIGTTPDGKVVPVFVDGDFAF